MVLYENPTKESDQAQELRQLLADVNSTEVAHRTTENVPDNVSDNRQKVDILNLPPRKEIHNGKSKPMKMKIARPYIRMVVVVLLIVILFAGGYYLWSEELMEIIQDI